MAQPVSSQPEIPSLPRPAPNVAPAIMAGGAGLGVVILLAALVLWIYYGTAVFFEMIASGIAGCF
jgi:hypothetical protein